MPSPWMMTMAAGILACYHTIAPIQDDLNNRPRDSGYDAPALAQYSFPTNGVFSLKISGNPPRVKSTILSSRSGYCSTSLALPPWVLCPCLFRRSSAEDEWSATVRRNSTAYIATVVNMRRGKIHTRKGVGTVFLFLGLYFLHFR